MIHWYGLLVSGGTPKEIVAELSAEVVRILDQPDVRERLAGDGTIVVGSTPDEFATFIRKEITTNARIVRASGMTAGN